MIWSEKTPVWYSPDFRLTGPCFIEQHLGNIIATLVDRIRMRGYTSHQLDSVRENVWQQFEGCFFFLP